MIKILCTILVILWFIKIFLLYLYYKIILLKKSERFSFYSFLRFNNEYWIDKELDFFQNIFALQPIFFLFIKKEFYPFDLFSYYSLRKKICVIIIISLLLMLIMVNVLLHFNLLL